MGNDYFDPVGLRVDPGTTVRFEIASGSHSATAYENRIPAGATAFDSTTMSDGGFEHTFETPGTYDYYCTPHQSMGMTGRIVVGEPGGPAEATPLPDGTVPDSETIIEQGSIPAEDADGSEKAGRDGVMPGNPGTKGGDGHGPMMLLPVGLFTAVLGAIAGALYVRADGRDSDVR